MIPFPKWFSAPAIQSKNGLRRMQHTHKTVDMDHLHVRFDIGRFLYRSKYQPHQGAKEMERRK